MYNTFRDTDPLPKDPSLTDYGFNIHQPDYIELFTPKKIVKEEDQKADK